MTLHNMVAHTHPVTCAKPASALEDVPLPPLVLANNRLCCLWHDFFLACVRQMFNDVKAELKAYSEIRENRQISFMQEQKQKRDQIVEDRKTGKDKDMNEEGGFGFKNKKVGETTRAQVVPTPHSPKPLLPLSAPFLMLSPSSMLDERPFKDAICAARRPLGMGSELMEGAHVPG